MRLFGRSIERRAFNWPMQTPWGGSGTEAVPVTQSSALGLSTVWACVRLLSSTVSRMPVDTLINVDGVPKAYREPRWLRRPILGNPNFDRLAHFTQAMTSLLFDGNLFVATPRDDSGDVSELYVLDPNRVEITGSISSPGYKVSTDRGQVEYGPMEVLHRPLIVMPGSSRGISPLESARQVISLGLSAQEYGTRFFTQDARPGGYIAVPAGSKTSADELRDGWVNAHAGPTNWHKPGVLVGGAEFKSLGITNQQSQFLETRGFQTAEVARVYGVPPHLVGDVERSTSWGTGIEEMTLGFLTYTVNDYLVLLESAYSSIVPNPNSYLRFNRNSILRGRAGDRADFYQKLWGMGALSPDEVRAKEDLPPLPDGDGDRYYVPLNYRPADEPIPVPTASTPPAENAA